MSVTRLQKLNLPALYSKFQFRSSYAHNLAPRFCSCTGVIWAYTFTSHEFYQIPYIWLAPRTIPHRNCYILLVGEPETWFPKPGTIHAWYVFYLSCHKWESITS